MTNRPMTTFTRSRFATVLRAAAPPMILALVTATLLRFPPEHYSFYPQCPIHALLHLQCPGCGATRALAALLRGHLAEAMRDNALVTLLSPFAAAYSAILYRRFLKREPFRWPQPHPAAIYAAFSAAIAFTVVRNLTLSF
jgi:Protein of unknown function (DUF2752)